ncbi:MAG: class I SAM-dependent methyltransferase, partial [Verrucomicrobiota bacterium]
ANRSLTAQFESRSVLKGYRLRAGASPRPRKTEARFEPLEGGGWRVTSWMSKVGDRQASQPSGPSGAEAVTEFVPAANGIHGEWMARPRTGRTHQIRVHAAALGMPIRGDALYGGSDAPRLFLHAESLSFAHPSDGIAMPFHEPPNFDDIAKGSAALARAMFHETETNAHRCWHGAAHGRPGWSVDRLGDYLLAASGEGAPHVDLRQAWPRASDAPKGIYVKAWRRDVQRTQPEDASPALVEGIPAPPRFEIIENGVRFALSMEEGYSAGLFLDQRDNRRRLLAGHVGHAFPWPEAGLRGSEALNAFAYTGGFSVCAALAGARVTSLDLSRKYLDWCRDNLRRNGLDPGAHDFIYGDCFDWMGRLARKGRRFDLLMVDPPTFSRSREHGDFRAEKDYGRLAELTARLAAPGAVLFFSTNAARLAPADFLGMVRSGVGKSGKVLRAEHYAPQPPDFPVTRDQPAYLKTVWLRLG